MSMVDQRVVGAQQARETWLWIQEEGFVAGETASFCVRHGTSWQILHAFWR